MDVLSVAGMVVAAFGVANDGVVGAAGGAAAPWQQGVRYRIEARLDESSDVLHGRVRIRYANESPDTLTEFYLHQYLNAFRPNSAWARRDLVHGDRTFQDLGPDEHAYERIRSASVEGRAVEPFYPHAPDSTIAGFRLPRPLPPGDSITVEVDWDARLSTIPRRQGRRGRSYDFAQWYPRSWCTSWRGGGPTPSTGRASSTGSSPPTT